MKYYPLIVLLLLFTACRSLKRESTYTRGAKVEMHDEMAVHLDSTAQTHHSLQQWLAAHEQLDIDFVLYRAPDSAGQQSVLATGHAKRNTQQSAVASEEKETATAMTAAQKVKSELQQQEQTESHTKKSKSLGLKFYISTALFLLLIFIINKYKEKWLH